MSNFVVLPAAPCVRQRQQSGVVLVVVLLFMLALTTIAIFGARNVTLGERLARNETEYQVARQAAEAALRDAERDLYPDLTLPAPTADCTRRRDESSIRGGNINATEFTTACLGGQCGFPTSDARYQTAWSAASGSVPGAPWWPTTKGGLWNGSGGTGCSTYNGAVPLGRYTGVAALRGVAQQPDYLIEYMGDPTQENVLIDYKCNTTYTELETGVVFNAADETVSGAKPFSPSCYLFRITARGFGPTIQTQVVMQSYFSIVIPESDQ